MGPFWAAQSGWPESPILTRLAVRHFAIGQLGDLAAVEVRILDHTEQLAERVAYGLAMVRGRIV
jgi:hypothetical protein